MLDALPAAAAQRLGAPDVTGPLPESYYAVHVSLVEAEPTPLIAEDAGEADDVEQLLQDVNDWFASQLGDRRLRFFYHGPVADARQSLKPGAVPSASAARLFAGANLLPALGQRQQIQVLLVKGRGLRSWACPFTVVMALSPRENTLRTAQNAAALAHLLGHALGLGHPVADIDTSGTAFASENSFMNPGAAARGLAASIVLDSPLNPEKAQLIASGFFPYAGRVYTAQDGAIILQQGMVIEGSDQELRVALGHYVLPCEAGRAAVTIRGQNLTVDLGGALLRGDTEDFTKFGDHRTYGIGVLLDGGAGLTLRGGVISGYHYGVKARALTGGVIEGVSVTNNRRLLSDASREVSDKRRGIWLDFWETPEESDTELWSGVAQDDTFYAAMGAGIVLTGCLAMTCRRTLATHNTVGIADFYGQGNRYEENDVSGCAMGIRLWQARGGREQRLVVTNNIMHFNTQPVPYWWSGGDGAAIIGAGVSGCDITGNRIAFGGDGVFLSGLPRLPGQTQDVLITGNQITQAYSHGIELDFASNCVIEGNTVTLSWLSGVWAGHAAGILILRNVFTANNRGRLYGGWTDSQGAISCPQGRITVVGNTFVENWVAINLLADPQPAWWLFSGDATRHIVTGNTFQENQVGVRLNRVSASRVTGNRMVGNTADVIGGLAENTVTENGPDTDPSGYRVVHMPIEALLFDRGSAAASFTVSAVTAAGAEPLCPVSVTVDDPEVASWLTSAQATDGVLHVAINKAPGFNGLDFARLTIAAGGMIYHVPVKLMGGDYGVSVGRAGPNAVPSAVGAQMPVDSGEALGRTPVGPAAIWGLAAPLSTTLRTEYATVIIGEEAFWANFAQFSFHVPAAVTKAFVAVWADDVLQLSFDRAAPCYSSPELQEGQVWQWASGTVEISQEQHACGVRYTHRRAGENGVVGCTALWLYPLDSADLAKLDAVFRVAADAAQAGASYLSLPGARRFYRPLP